MPIYEYDCADCKRKVSVLFLTMRQAQEEAPACPRCSGIKLTRVVSRFAVSRTASSGGSPEDLSGMPDPDNPDPRSLARWMRQMGQETGEPMPPEMEGVLDRLESGEDPDAIGQELEQEEGAGVSPGAGGLGQDSSSGAGDL